MFVLCNLVTKHSKCWAGDGRFNGEEVCGGLWAQRKYPITFKYVKCTVGSHVGRLYESLFQVIY